MPSDIQPLIHGNFYHIYNRGNNRETIFPQERNYSYFLELWWKHVSPVAETWAYCLLGNHFHVAVYIKDKADSTGSKEPSQCFSNFFNAFSRGVNIATQRTGALFERPFKRIPIGSTKYLMQLIIYIHQNPQKHKFVDDFRAWNYSSYPLLVSDLPSQIEKERVMELFGTMEDFVRIHQEIQPVSGFEDESNIE